MAAQSVSFHQTLTAQGNIMNIISGNFWERNNCSIWNHHTVFRVLEMKFGVNGIIRLNPVYTQPFMSKVYTIIKGPAVNGWDTFFAARDSDILQFCYCPHSRIFKCINSYTLPKVSMEPNYLQTNGTRIFASTVRGGWCIIDLESKRIIECGSTSHLVVMVCQFSEDVVARFEKQKIVKYSLSDLTKTTLNVPLRGNLLMIGSWRNGSIVVIFKDLDGSVHISIVSDSAVIKEERLDTGYEVTSLCKQTVNDTLVLMLLLKNNKKTFLYRVDEKPEDPMGLLLRECTMKGVPTDFGLRLLSITNRHFLLMNRTIRHYVFDVVYDVENVSGMQLTLCAKIDTTMGTRNMKRVSTAVIKDDVIMGKHYPHTISQSSKFLVIRRYGIPCPPYIHERYNQDPAATNIFFVQYENHYLIFLSFMSHTKLYELKIHEKSIEECKKFMYVSNERTHAIYKDSGSMFRQVVDSGTYPFPGNGKILNETTFDLQLEETSVANGESKQVVIRLINEQTSENAKVMVFFNRRNILTKPHEVNAHITSLALCAPNDTSNVYIGYGCKRDDKFWFEIREVVAEGDGLFYVQELVKMDMCDEVTGVKFAERRGKGGELQIVVILGLFQGNVLMGTLNKDMGLVDIDVYPLGFAPVRLFNGCSSNSFFGLSSRTYVLTVTDKYLDVIPLIMLPASFVQPIDPSEFGKRRDNLRFFIALSSSNIGFYRANLEEDLINTDYVPYRNNLLCESTLDPVALCPVGAQYMLFASESTIGCFDTFTRKVYEVTEFKSESTIKILACSKQDMSFQGQRYCFAVYHVVRNNQGKLTGIITLFEVTLRSISPIHIRQIAAGANKRLITAMDVIIMDDTINVICGMCDYIQIMSAKFNSSDLQCSITAKLPGLVPDKITVEKPKDGGVCYDIIVGDKNGSVRVFAYNYTQKTIVAKCEEGTVRTITAMGTFNNGKSIYGGDMLGNFFLLDQADSSHIWKAHMDPGIWSSSERLKRRMNFYIGDVITGVCHYGGTMRRETATCYMYETISGGFGIIVTPMLSMNCREVMKADFAKRMRILRSLETEMSSLFLELTNCDHIAFRNKFYPCTNIIDMDIIVVFLCLSPEKKDEVCKKISFILNEPTLTSDMIEREIRRMKRHIIASWEETIDTV